MQGSTVTIAVNVPTDGGVVIVTVNSVDVAATHVPAAPKLNVTTLLPGVATSNPVP